MMNEQKKGFHQIIVMLLSKYTKDQSVIQNYKKYSRFSLPARFANAGETPQSKNSTEATPKTGRASETAPAGGNKLMGALFGGASKVQATPATSESSKSVSGLST